MKHSNRFINKLLKITHTFSSKAMEVTPGFIAGWLGDPRGFPIFTIEAEMSDEDKECSSDWLAEKRVHTYKKISRFCHENTKGLRRGKEVHIMEGWNEIL